MRLKNKKTGEIVDFRYLQSDHVAPLVLTTYKNNKPEMYSYNSLSELNADWEDAPEEPKEYYCIDWTEPSGIYQNKDEDLFDDFNKEIGNYFSSREEAELAVRKLKAWKRLKSHNLRIGRGQRIFVNADNELTSQKPLFVVDTYEEVEDDLDLLFGGKE